MKKPEQKAIIKIGLAIRQMDLALRDLEECEVPDICVEGLKDLVKAETARLRHLREEARIWAEDIDVERRQQEECVLWASDHFQI